MPNTNIGHFSYVKTFQNEDDDDTYGEPLHNTKPQLLCKPNPRNITGEVMTKTDPFGSEP